MEVLEQVGAVLKSSEYKSRGDLPGRVQEHVDRKPSIEGLEEGAWPTLEVEQETLAGCIQSRKQ